MHASAAALAANPSIQLQVGGRDESRARTLAAQLGSDAEGVEVDLSAPGFSDVLERLGVERVRRERHIAADNDHGPEIPRMAAILMARRLAHGHTIPAGAHACMGLLGLDDFQPEFERWGMQTDIATEELPDGAPAF